MGKDLYSYDVYDHDDLILENATLSDVSKKLGVSKKTIINYAINGWAINGRYHIKRIDIDSEKIDVEVDKNFRDEWDKYRTLARKALRDPKAVARFYLKLQAEAAAKEG